MEEEDDLMFEDGGNLGSEGDTLESHASDLDSFDMDLDGVVEKKKTNTVAP